MPAVSAPIAASALGRGGRGTAGVQTGLRPTPKETARHADALVCGAPAPPPGAAAAAAAAPRPSRRPSCASRAQRRPSAPSRHTSQPPIACVCTHLRPRARARSAGAARRGAARVLGAWGGGARVGGRPEQALEQPLLQRALRPEQLRHAPRQRLRGGGRARRRLSAARGSRPPRRPGAWEPRAGGRSAGMRGGSSPPSAPPRG